ncbi:MAG: hypothetical protein QNJ44_09040 [Rhodobacter sp.]|nr:hypothetical protein [Rhodobacter sp.]
MLSFTQNDDREAAMLGAQTAFAVATALTLVAPMAQAEDATFWKNVGDWEISIDPTISDGCYAVATWNGGTVLRIGRNPQEDNFYFLIGNDKWASLQPDEPYDIEIQFGSRAPWDVSANGLQFNPGETVYLHAQSTKMDFIREFQRALSMKISYNDNEIDNLKLTGSRRAWDEVENCQRQVAARGPGSASDPFATGGSGSGKSKRATDDPFASN